MIPLPDPRSSAGVPRNTISPGSSLAIVARAIAAPTPEAAIELWPQPWPRPGRASYSARMPIRGRCPPSPPGRMARTAVSRLPAGCSTTKPWRATASATQPAAWRSSKAGSGSAWIRWDSPRISARFASTAAAIRRFASANGSAGAVASRSNDSTVTEPPTITIRASPLGGQGRFGDRHDDHHEQGDGQTECALEAEDDEDGHDDRHPRAPTDRSEPVSTICDPPVPAEDHEPEQRDTASVRRRGP